MKRYLAKILLVAGVVITVAPLPSCKKYTDQPGKPDPRLSRKYCNDPDAVNFNRDFPGTADNSVCIYPSDVFKGNYGYVDSIYDGDEKLQGQISFNLVVSAIDRFRFSIDGLCTAGGAPVTLTGNRALRATVDTTIGTGQPLCLQKDTVSGYILQSETDSTALNFYLTVVSDTGVTYHQGTAYRH